MKAFNKPCSFLSTPANFIVHVPNTDCLAVSNSTCAKIMCIKNKHGPVWAVAGQKRSQE